MSKSYKQLKHEIKMLTLAKDVALSVVASLRERVKELEDNTESKVMAEHEPPKYKIGKFGQAGIVFYDKGFYSDDWRYMEVTKSKYEFKAQWSEGLYDVETEEKIGSGDRNTKNIRNSLYEVEINKAAQLCYNLKIDYYNDWFLPSKDELNLIYKNLHKKGIGDFKDACYWSSSQYYNNVNNAWLQNFNNGNQNYSYSKANTTRVRAVRAF